MADRPIIFSASMVRALLDGVKTQTRRVLKPQPPEGAHYNGIHFDSNAPDAWFFNTPHGGFRVRQRFDVGDRLWVREGLRRESHTWIYDADRSHVPWPARGEIAGLTRDSVSSMMMRRACSRLTLTVTDVRVQRLQEISEEDAVAEGVQQCRDGEATGAYTAPGSPDFLCGWSAAGAYRRLWDVLHGSDAWSANPWVVALTFTVEQRNIDALREAA